MGNRLIHIGSPSNSYYKINQKPLAIIIEQCARQNSMKMTIDQALRKGISAHKKGRLQDAERLYRAILKSEPLHQDANHNLGILAISVNNLEAALSFFNSAIDANPTVEQFWLSYIDALIKAQDYETAKKICKKAEMHIIASEKLRIIQEQLSYISVRDYSELDLLDKSMLPAQKHKKIDQRKSKKKGDQSLELRIPPHQQLSNLLKSFHSGHYSDAAKQALTIVNEFPSYQLGWKVLGAALKQSGNVIESLNAMQKSVLLAPHDAESHSNLGSTLLELGKLDEAKQSCKNAIKLNPKFGAAHNNLGITLKALGRFEEAAESFKKAITLKFDNAEVYNNLGATLQEIGRLKDAELFYKKSITLNPRYAEAHNNIGALNHKLQKFDEAEASFKKAMELKPGFSQACNNLGVTQQELGRFDKAEACYLKAIEENPTFEEAYINLCDLLEKMNRNGELLSLARSEPIRFFRRRADIFYYEALIEFRKENYDISRKLMERFNIEDLERKRQPSAIKLQGDIYHHYKNYRAAFDSYKTMNKLVKISEEYSNQSPEKFFSQQIEKISQLEVLQNKSKYKLRPTPKWWQPTFLIGFPRSGTTLLDTVLRTHSQIDVLEELPMVDRVSASLADVNTIWEIEAMDSKKLESASSYYFKELERHVEIEKTQLLIDKLPLNILQLPLISQIFPSAKYIVALRHPLDCLLSNWIQDFRLNPAMSNMVDLDRIAEFYGVAMSILTLCEKRYSLETHRIRYEDLVSDFDGVISGLLEFLDLEWEEELRNYHVTALARDRINTPSSSQVIKPLYKTSFYRWEKYEEYLGAYKKRLSPWISEFGY